MRILKTFLFAMLTHKMKVKKCKQIAECLLIPNVGLDEFIKEIELSNRDWMI